MPANSRWDLIQGKRVKDEIKFYIARKDELNTDLYHIHLNGGSRCHVTCGLFIQYNLIYLPHFGLSLKISST